MVVFFPSTALSSACHSMSPSGIKEPVAESSGQPAGSPVLAEGTWTSRPRAQLPPVLHCWVWTRTAWSWVLPKVSVAC